MKKTTSKKLAKKIAKYSALSVAIAGVSEASGQIVYTDIGDVTIDGASTEYILDIDNDASGDFIMRVNPTSNTSGPVTPFAFMFPATGSYYNSNGIVGFSSGGFNYPSNFNSGSTISSGAAFITGARGDLNYNSCAYPGSQFCGGTDGFLGLSFLIGVDTHYGWARVQVSADATSMIIKDYAYNSTPDASIDAGQQTLGVSEFEVNSIQHKYNNTTKVLTLDSQITLNEMRVFNILGQESLKVGINNTHTEVDMSNLQAGVYIARIVGDNNASKTIKLVVK
jgi:hypothetical protein